MLGETEEEMAGLRGGVELEGIQRVDDPVGSRGEQVGVHCSGAKTEDASPRSFPGTRAGRSILRDHAVLRMKLKGGGAFKVRFGIGLAPRDVAGGHEVPDARPETGCTQAHFGEGSRGGSDDRKLGSSDAGEKFFRAGKRDDIVDILDFGPFHPIVFGEMDRGVGMGEKFLDGGETGAAVSMQNGVIRIEIVFAGPARPDASDGGGGVDEDAVHVKEQALTVNLAHALILRHKSESADAWLRA